MERNVFVSYVYHNSEGNICFGCSSVTMPSKERIRNMDDIEAIKNLLETERSIQDVVVLNFTPFEK